MGQQSSLALPTVQNNPINFTPQIHEFQSQNVQRIKQTPFVGSIIYSSQPSIYIQPTEMTMESLVVPRLNTNKLFPKEQIHKVIENVLTALNELSLKNFQRYGNLSLTNIFYQKQSKNFKLVNPAFFNSTNCLMAREGLRFSFLAPEQLLSLTSQGYEEGKNFKTDIFIVGICLLQMCTLRDSRQIYCPQTYNIFDVEIKDRLKDVEQYYSIQLSNFLQLCLQYEMDNRIDLQNAISEIKFIRQKQKGEQLKTTPHQQGSAQVLSPRADVKKRTLPFGPGNLPKKLPPNTSNQLNSL